MSAFQSISFMGSFVQKNALKKVKGNATTILKNSLKHCSTNPNPWEDLASDQSAWHSKVHSGVAAYEKQHIVNATQKCLQHTEKASNPLPPGQERHPYR